LDGGIWIDWCGWPGYYQVFVDGSMATYGQSNFRALVEFLGYDWLRDTTFVPKFAGGVGGLQYFLSHLGAAAYPFDRGYPLSGSQAGVYYPIGDFEPGGFSQAGPFGFGPVTAPLTSDGYTCLMCLHREGTGYYVYAVYSPQEWVFGIPSLLTPVTPFVPAPTIADFVLAVVEGRTRANGMRIAHAPYEVSTPVAPTSPTGPTSPYQPGKSAPGIRIEGNYFVLLTPLSAQQVAEREGVSLQALLDANPGATYAREHPTYLLKAGTRLRIPSSGGAGGGGSGGGKEPRTPSPSNTPASVPPWLRDAGYAAAGVGVIVATWYGYRWLQGGALIQSSQERE
jgi:hypothetical protein